ncbi:Hypothetical_protein [Hexamita inflata]|uniref:Hypothetical_protein n=1 Tax=Hexamita inflata TaxID=28002 RepID=A0AA86QMB3_9EUKA|nr:Hypothetical protein HINF_LOCUS49894 [Hexamita inflata]
MFRAPVHLVLLAVMTDCPFPSCYSFWTLNFQSGSLVFFRSISFSSRNSSTLQLHFCLKSTRVLSSYPLWMKSSACGTLTLLSITVSVFRYNFISYFDNLCFSCLPQLSKTIAQRVESHLE